VTGDRMSVLPCFRTRINLVPVLRRAKSRRKMVFLRRLNAILFLCRMSSGGEEDPVLST
jgi:hypothetical protein